MLFLNLLAWTFARTGIGLGPLAAQRQAAAVTHATITTQVHQALDAHGNFATQIAFHGELPDFGTQRFDLGVRQIFDLGRRADFRRDADFAGAGTADPIDRRQRHPYMLAYRYIDSC